MGGLLGSLSGLLVALTAMAWLGRAHPVFELVTNVRFQLLLVAVAVMIVSALLRRPRLAAIAALVGVIHVISMMPYWTAQADPIVAGTKTAQILQYNVFFGNDDYPAIAELINSSPAAVVGLHEITDEQWGKLQPMLTTHPHSVAVPVSADVGQLGGGMALLSRNPVIEIEVGSPANRRERPILAIETEVLGEQVTVIGLHPHASRFESAKYNLRNEQLGTVSAVAGAAPGPAIVVTDMNMTPHSPDYQDFVDGLGWRDPHRIVGWKASWPTFASAFGTPIDHIFVSNELLLHDYEMGPAAGSDHLSVVATISRGIGG